MDDEKALNDRELWARYQAANHYINEGLIRLRPDEPSDAASVAKQRTRREWMLSFLPRLGDPQRAFEAIHVAGTSGKGSVCAMVAEILRAGGVRAGLHISPYLQVATEKLWVDGLLATVEQYEALIEWLRPHAEACRGPDVPMHGMGSVAIFLEHFRREAVQLGVVEVGVGGGSDLTNVLETRVAAITNVGPDHLKTLGPTLEDVARHKAGIITPGCRAVVHATGDDDRALIAARRRAESVGAPLRVVRPERDYGLLPPAMMVRHGCGFAASGCSSTSSPWPAWARFRPKTPPWPSPPAKRPIQIWKVMSTPRPCVWASPALASRRDSSASPLEQRTAVRSCSMAPITPTSSRRCWPRSAACSRPGACTSSSAAWPRRAPAPRWARWSRARRA
jgi:hypothetical protein